MNKIKIGILGCANIAQRSVIPAILETGIFNLSSIASRKKEKALRLTERFGGKPVEGYQNLIENNALDALYVPLPTGLHHEWIKKALLSGKHVIAEKSLAMNYDSAKELIDIARKRNLVLMENFMYRYHSQHNMVFSLLEKKEIGEVRLFRTSFGFPPLDKKNFRYNKKLGGGAVYDAAAYLINASMWFLGSDLEVVSSNLTVDAETDIVINGSASLYNKTNGIVSQIAFGFDNFYQCSYEFWGSKGKIIADRAYTAKPDYNPKIVVEKQGIRTEYSMPADNHFINIFNEFANCIISGNYEKHNQTTLSQSKIISEIQEKAKFYNM